ncbi:MAG: dockerin type I domain-containing protein [Patescibacteria group bacterium]
MSRHVFRKMRKISFFLIVSIVILTSGIVTMPGFVRADGATIPPANILDLAVVGVGSSSIQLTWSAVGADGYVEPATAYDMRIAQYSFTMGAWNSLTRVSSTPVPGQPGIQESFVVTGLSPATIYYIAVRGVDSFGTISMAYNIVTATTASAGPTSVSNVLFSPRLESAPTPSGKSFTITLYNAGTATTAATFTGLADVNGRVALPGTVSLPAGLYDIMVSSQGYLRKKLFEYNVSSNAIIMLPMLPVGDINNDNIINSLDWSVMSGRWFSNDTTADINKDGIVNSIDWSYLSKNWFVTGDN